MVHFVYVWCVSFSELALLQEQCWSCLLGGLRERGLFSWSSFHLDCFLWQVCGVCDEINLCSTNYLHDDICW